MAYQDMTPHSQVLNREISLTRSFFSGIAEAFNNTMLWLMENSAGNARVQVVRKLQAKSDVELAALKIKREDIVHHVFRDLYYV